ncbi:hypothetical protein DM860_009553 [Cuscuta australis]|uniref:CRM domain-containing protein n=1 Tax=Cuscuta australis TaxID=267555 RepID=A0A328DMZ8_9ASTE|nr:hypothetical protein DM860_009553 [Cuscuta australis]
MVVRGLMLVTLRKSPRPGFLFSTHIVLRAQFLHSVYRKTCLCNHICKVFWNEPAIGPLYGPRNCNFRGTNCVRFLSTFPRAPESVAGGNVAADGIDPSKEVKVKRKKLKGRRAVVKWLKCLRWKKKKEFQKMTAEEKLLFNLRKARKKEERLIEALKKIEPKETSEATHDPEILTPEEHFYFLKMGLKCKNYVPVGRRGIYQGVILNMHLHWKKHQTLKVIVKTFSPEEVKEIAAELARLSGGIVLDIQDDDTIIMYRGKNYSQPPTEIMSPRCTLPRKKALDKSKYRDSLRAVRRYIPRLEHDLELLHAQAGNHASFPEENKMIGSESCNSDHHFELQAEASKQLNEVMHQTGQQDDENNLVESDPDVDSEDLSDIFETESEEENEDRNDTPLYLHEFEKFPSLSNRETKDFEEDLSQVCADSRRGTLQGRDIKAPDLEEVDKMILQAASLLKKNRR